MSQKHGVRMGMNQILQSYEGVLKLDGCDRCQPLPSIIVVSHCRRQSLSSMIAMSDDCDE
jgi:hypothetical protein